MLDLSKYLRAEEAAPPVGAEPNRGERSTERLPVPTAEIESAVRAAGEHIASLFKDDPDGLELAQAALVAWTQVRGAAPQYRGVFPGDLAPAILAVVNVLRADRQLAPLAADAVYHRDKVSGTTTGLLPELIASGVFTEQWARGRTGRSVRSVTLPALVRAAPARTAAAAVSLLTVADLRARMAKLSPGEK